MSLLDSGRAIRDVLLPVVARGAILRRQRAMRLAERLQVDERALRQVRRLRTRYDGRPVPIRIAGRTIALVTTPEDVHRVLEMTPMPFSAATTEKIGALRHFQPHAVLITDPPLRRPRRDLNEQVLQTHQPVHEHAHQMRKLIHEELAELTETVGWLEFRDVWSRIVRRIVLGDAARDGTELTDELDKLRAAANWAEFAPRQNAVRRNFAEAIDRYVEAAEPGSLVSMLPPDKGDVDPTGQVPHWLFAFDAAGIAIWRALAVVATQPELADRIATEAQHPESSPLLALAGGAVQESLRLWPTTLVVLRESRTDTVWRGQTLPAGTQFAIVSSVFHRDDEALEFADRFEPDIWLDRRTERAWPIIPFSAGPARCPGENVVLLTTSSAISYLLDHNTLDLDPRTRSLLAGPMPKTFDHTRPRIAFWRKS
ncbi:cytochrome P450 [Kribbella sp. NPDC058245]|uniref:cytochrome P450 n=1 Tax=Kribbella sp. NPDC058245 TaxID=3346399 RepID=UPI0036F058CF